MNNAKTKRLRGRSSACKIKTKNEKGENALKRTVRTPVDPAYSLHDININGILLDGDRLTLTTQSGIVRAGESCAQVDGRVEFFGVDTDLCCVTVFDAIGNAGAFSGERMPLADFLIRFPVFGFSVLDELYGYNQTRYQGHLTAGGGFWECILEVYHEGDMVFVEE